MKIGKSNQILFGATLLYIMPIESIGEKSREHKTSDNEITTGIEDSIKTNIYSSDSNSVHQEALISFKGRKATFTIRRNSSDTACHLEISGSANRIYARREMGCPTPYPAPDLYRRYLGKKKECIVEIQVNSKWLTYSTSNCEINEGCKSIAPNQMRFFKDTIVTKWVEFPKNKIVVPPW